MTEREYNRFREIIPPKQEPNTKEKKKHSPEQGRAAKGGEVRSIKTYCRPACLEQRKNSLDRCGRTY